MSLTCFVFSSRRRHTRCALVTGVQTCALPIYDRNGVLIDSVRVDFQVRRLAWTPLDKVSPMMRDTLIASEDQRFRRHHGVDWLAIIGAVRDRIAGRRGRGASMLTMQLAGFLSPDLAAPGARGWLDKLRDRKSTRLNSS